MDVIHSVAHSNSMSLHLEMADRFGDYSSLHCCLRATQSRQLLYKIQSFKTGKSLTFLISEVDAKSDIHSSFSACFVVCHFHGAIVLA